MAPSNPLVTNKRQIATVSSRINVSKPVGILLLLILSFLLPLSVGARAYQSRGSRQDVSYVVYIPDKLDVKKRHPWIIGFSPSGNGQEVLNAMQLACDQNGWILVASNNSRNGVDFNTLEPMILDTINSATRTLPVDPNLMHAGGLSGGSQVSHWLVQKYPQLVCGLVINCGMIERTLQKELGYPSGKSAVFMTNPQDFRYNEIRADCQYLVSHGWHTRWMEFPGGHQWAPPEYYSAAFKWLNQEDRQKHTVAADRPIAAPSLSDLQSQLDKAEKNAASDPDRITKIKEQIADAQVKNGKPAEAESTYKQLLDAQQQSTPDSSVSADLMSKLADLYGLEGKNEDAADILQKIVSIREKGADKAALSKAVEAYAKALYKTGKTTEADAQYARLKELLKK